MTDVAPLKMRIRGLVLQPFTRAKKELAAMETLEQVEAFSGRFRRQLEVAGELASRQFSEGFAHLVERLQSQLSSQFEEVMTDLAPNLPKVQLSANALLVTPDQMQALQRSQQQTRVRSRTGAVAGGLAGGGATLAAGAAMLGPVGLIGGALVGWKLHSIVAGQRNLERARRTIIERLDEVADELLRDVDGQVSGAVDTVRAAVERRRRAFASDLYQQFEVVQEISEDPSRLEAYRRDAERFDQAFAACGQRAQKALTPAAPLREAAHV
jgi:hypothetical protein